MHGKNLRQIIYPLGAAMIWGTAFVAQSLGAGTLGTFAFNMARAVVATVGMLLFLLLRHLKKPTERTEEEKRAYRHDLLIGGLTCGMLLTVATNLQQYGLEETSPGKAGFITALYIVLVPLFGLFLKKPVSPLLWVSVAFATAGLYFLCFEGGAFTFTGGDLYVFLCAIVFSVHILALDYFSKRLDGIELSCAQFAVVSLLSLAGMYLFESPTVADFTACMPYILYLGIFSSGIAYTLQILAQKAADSPTLVSILLSTESFFAVVSGALILHEKMLPREYFGCVLMVVAVVLAQLKIKKKA